MKNNVVNQGATTEQPRSNYEAVNGQVGQAALGALLATPFFISPKPIFFELDSISALLRHE